MPTLGGAYNVAQFLGAAPGYLNPLQPAPAPPAPAPVVPFSLVPTVRPSGQVDSCPVILERNWSTFALQFSQLNLAPHAGTVRFQYTVPAGRAAWLQSGLALVQTIVVGNAGQSAVAQLVVLPARTAPAAVLDALRWCGDAAGSITDVSLSSQVLLLPGDVVQGVTSDPDTQPLARRSYVISATVREFDLP